MQTRQLRNRPQSVLARTPELRSRSTFHPAPQRKHLSLAVAFAFSAGTLTALSSAAQAQALPTGGQVRFMAGKDTAA